ncbi:MAG TPA: putative baseplate assembly protein [Candidatus Binatia bacterium]|nr:putative baseplate assembly protein [Candidatus Binatia bacterium]
MIYQCCNENRKAAVLNNPSSITATPTVDAPGSGYAAGDVLTIVESGSSGTATVTVVSVAAGGAVSAVSLAANGTGYTTATGVATTGGSGSGCTLNIAGTPNGIDYLEVLDSDAVPLGLPRQQILLIHCLRSVPTTLTRDNVMITGGESITGIVADWVAPANNPPASLTPPQRSYFQSLADVDNVLLVMTSVAGDFSPYVLRLVNDLAHAEEDPFQVTDVLTGFDPQLAEVTFSFKVECGPNFDCAPQPPNCPPDLPSPPPINYLAKDYGSFRSIMLDRLSQLLPGWSATSEADMGIALAELIAFVGDRLSYQQDAVATESYLETARSRISLRRHALLVDYHVHDGCNARAWIQISVSGNTGDKIFLDRTRTRFYTYAPGMPSSLAVGAGNEEAALLAGVQVFEPMWDQILYPELNQMSFYTWGEGNCCLPQGTTEATLRGSFPNLQPGDVLVFQEMVGPQTGEPADADLRHRCAVRLTQVATQDASGNPLVDPLFDENGKPIQSPAQNPTPVTEIQWSQDDALPFPVCISSTFVDASGDTQSLTEVSLVFGNVVLADHGLSLTGVSMGTVPAPSIYLPPNPAADRCLNALPTPLPVRFQPQVPDSPLTQAVAMTDVAIGELGNPQTSAIVQLPDSGFVSLSNAEGFSCLTLRATNASGWPQSFGVLVAANSGHPGNIDLSVVYDPSTGGAGIHKLVAVEKFTDLSLNSGDPNYVVNAINGTSQLIQIPGSYNPPTTPPSGFPATPTLLSNSGPVNLLDTSSKPYLTLEPVNPSGWPVLFGVEAQPGGSPAYFDLDVVYSPSHAVGVTLPVVVEEFDNLSLASAASQINGNSILIAVESFASTADSSLSAYALMNFDANQALPVITLSGTSNTNTEIWEPQQDLLENGESDRVFVVEVEYDGTATLRFGDNTNGLAPETGTAFTANYRVGNGTAGNVGADSLIYLAAGDARIQKCRNPLPASGGVDPETNDQIRRRAPQAFLTQERAVTMADYAAVTEQNSQVDQAVATLRWTGSWYTVFIAVEPQGAGNLTLTLQKTLKRYVERYHLAGQDLELDSPQYVPLQIELEICVDPNYFMADVQRGLMQVLGSGISPNGVKGLFYPDNFTFGQTVYLSPIFAAARSIAGVVAVRATTFQPQGLPPTTQYLTVGEIKLGPLQIARLANDPSYPNHGQLTLVLEGGK